MYASCQSEPLLPQKHQSYEGAVEDNYLEPDYDHSCNDGEDDFCDDTNDDFDDDDDADVVDLGNDADDDFI